MPSLEHRINRWMLKYSITREEALQRINKLDAQYAKSAQNKQTRLDLGKTYVFKGNQEIQAQLDMVTYTYISTINSDVDMAVGDGKFIKTVLKQTPIKTEYVLDPITRKWTEIT